MADVRPPCADDRGQLILVGGIVVAVALLALVLLLNTTLFAGNVATSGIDPGVDRAADHAAFAADAGATILAAEHAPAAEPDTWTTVDNSIRHDVATVGAIAKNRSFGRFGAETAVAVDGTREGRVLIQTETGSYTDAESDPNWMLATTTGIRNFTMTVDATESTGTFTLRVKDDAGEDWTAEVDASGTEAELDTSSGTSGDCRAAVITIDWTAGTAADGACTFTFVGQPDDVTPPFEISFEDGDQVAGTYRLVVSTAGADESIETAAFEGPTADDSASPRWYPAAYSLVLETSYREGHTHYATPVRVAPGEPPQTRPP